MRFKKIILLLFGITILTALLVYSDFEKVFNATLEIDKCMLLLAFLSMSLFFYIRTLRWYLLLTKKIPFFRLSKILFIGTLANIIFPTRLGGIVKAFILKKTENYSFGHSFGSVFLDNVIEISYALISSLIVTTFFLSDISFEVREHLMFGILFFSGVVLSFFISFQLIQSDRFQLLLKKIPVFGGYNIQREKAFISNFNYYFRHMSRNISGIFLCYGLSSLVFINFMVLNFLLTNGFGYTISLPALFLVSTLPVILGVLSMIPGGLGIQEISMTGILTMAGLPIHISTSLAVLNRVIYTLWTVVLGVYGLSSTGIKMSEFIE